LRALILATLLLAAAPAPASAEPADDLRALMEEHYRWLLADNPVAATRLGVQDYDTRLRDLSAGARDRRVVEARTFLARLAAIPAAQLAAQDRVNHAILTRELRQIVDENEFGQRDMLFTTYYGWHQDFAGLADDVPLRTRADFDSYLARLEAYPQLNRAALERTEAAVRGGFVLPCSVLTGYDRTIEGVIAADPAQSRFYQPFTRPRPAAIPEADWTELQQRARRIVADVLNPEYRRHLDFLRTRYLPACQRTDSVSALPNGAAYYRLLARQFTTTDMTPEQIHAVGMREVERIRAEMDAVARDAGHPSRQAFIQQLRTDPRYYATSADQLLRESAYVTRTIDGHLPRLFGRMPRLPYTLRAIPAETAETTTTAYYSPGSPESGLAGTYYVNTSRLNQRPLWEIPALSLHEAAPGHHFQIALQQELDLPPFRRNFVGFTAYTEGWALYTEGLGRDMGLYDTPERRMGELSYQMWRAARLVVDTGIHAQGWDKARAIAFMRDNTALTEANIEAEVNRYISWPGQALGYMIGRLKILELRARAEAALGARFDIRRFHDAVLANGSVPLDVLEAEIDRWIAEERARTP
jgi:uncharacterized protein (DUF885 family)